VDLKIAVPARARENARGGVRILRPFGQTVVEVISDPGVIDRSLSGHRVAQRCDRFLQCGEIARDRLDQLSHLDPQCCIFSFGFVEHFYLSIEWASP
jgi:hypothetical protein